MKFTQTEDSKVFFSSDPHFSHKNICAGSTSWIKTTSDNPKDKVWPVPYHQWHDHDARRKFCKENGLRDFSSVEKMNSTIISRFNEKVGQDDTLFLIGDIGFGGKNSVATFMGQLTCKNVYLIYGNHDHDIETNRNGVQGYFKKCMYKAFIYVDNQYILLDHFAHRVWDKSHHGAWHLYGHSHSNLEHTPWGKSMDVGVDTNDMTPYSFDEIKRIMDKREILALDHHGR